MHFCESLFKTSLLFWQYDWLSLFSFLVFLSGSAHWTATSKQQYLCMRLNICVWGLSILCQLSLFSGASAHNTQTVETEVAFQFRLIWVYPSDQAVFKQMVYWSHRLASVRGYPTQLLVLAFQPGEEPIFVLFEKVDGHLLETAFVCLRLQWT